MKVHFGDYYFRFIMPLHNRHSVNVGDIDGLFGRNTVQKHFEHDNGSYHEIAENNYVKMLFPPEDDTVLILRSTVEADLEKPLYNEREVAKYIKDKLAIDNVFENVHYVAGVDIRG